MQRQLLFASRNPGKIREMRALLASSGLPCEVIGLGPDQPDVAETGATFEENALLKARAGCAANGLLCLAEDSGLEVDALGGEPGVRSARWVEGSDADRMWALLRRMEEVAEERRTARYVSVAALVHPDGTAAAVRGTLEGRIARAPRGTGGFGYDPIFVLPDGRTAAELTMEEKNAVSHRRQAFDRALPLLVQMLGR
jgi:XTP/dITP diphosphohydrolase